MMKKLLDYYFLFEERELYFQIFYNKHIILLKTKIKIQTLYKYVEIHVCVYIYKKTYIVNFYYLKVSVPF